MCSAADDCEITKSLSRGQLAPKTSFARLSNKKRGKKPSGNESTPIHCLQANTIGKFICPTNRFCVCPTPSVLVVCRSILFVQVPDLFPTFSIEIASSPTTNSSRSSVAQEPSSWCLVGSGPDGTAIPVHRQPRFAG